MHQKRAFRARRRCQINKTKGPPGQSKIMGLLGRSPKPTKAAAQAKTAPSVDPAAAPSADTALTKSPKKPDTAAVQTKQSRIASVPLKSTLHYRFSAEVSAEKRLRNRASQGDELEVRRLVGMGADINAANEVSARLASARTMPAHSLPPLPGY